MYLVACNSCCRLNCCRYTWSSSTQRYRITAQQWVWYLFPWVHKQKILEQLWKYLCYKNAISSFSRYSQNYRRSIRKVLKTFLKIHMYVHTCKYVSLSLIQHNQSTMFYYSHRCVNKSSMQRILQNSNLQIKNNPQAQIHSHSQWRIFHLFKHTNNNSQIFLKAVSRPVQHSQCTSSMLRASFVPTAQPMPIPTKLMLTSSLVAIAKMTDCLAS